MIENEKENHKSKDPNSYVSSPYHFWNILEILWI